MATRLTDLSAGDFRVETLFWLPVAMRELPSGKLEFARSVEVVLAECA